MWQISYPLAVGGCQGIHFLQKSHKLALFEEKISLQKQLWQLNLQTFIQLVFFSQFCFAGPEIIGSPSWPQTDGQIP